MLLRLLLRSWSNNWRAHALSVITIILASSLIAALLLVSIDVGDKMAKELKSYGANIMIEPASNLVLPQLFAAEQDALAVQEFLAEADLLNVKEIFWRNNILGFAPLLLGEVEAAGQKVTIEGTFFAQELAIEDEEGYVTGQQDVSPFWQLQGRYPVELLQPKEAPNEIVIGTALAQQYGWSIGDELALTGKHTTVNALVVGIVTSGSKEDRFILAPLQLSQRLLGLEGKIQAIQVSALTIPESEVSQRARVNLDLLDNEEYDQWYCSAYVSSIAHQLEEIIPGSIAKPIWQVAASEGAVIKKIQLLLLVVTIVAFFAAAMGIAALTVSNIMQRAKEIGLMKALGGNDWQISLLFYLEAMGNALFGGLFGCVIGVALADFISRQLFGTTVVIVEVVFPVVLVVALLIAWLGTWFAANRISKLYPAEILYGRI